MRVSSLSTRARAPYPALFPASRWITPLALMLMPAASATLGPSFRDHR